MRLKNVSGDTVDLPTVGATGERVAPGDEVTVTGNDATNLLASGLFERIESKFTEKES